MLSHEPSLALSTYLSNGLGLSARVSADIGVHLLEHHQLSSGRSSREDRSLGAPADFAQQRVLAYLFLLLLLRRRRLLGCQTQLIAPELGTRDACDDDDDEA